MANYNFNKDLAIGEKGEKDVLFDLESMGAKFIDDNKDNCYDLLVEKGGIQLKYEIKTSGIEVTKADWFVMHYKYLKEIWYIKTNELKELIKNNQFFKTEFSGDQNSNTKGYLIPREEYKEYFIVRSVK